MGLFFMSGGFMGGRQETRDKNMDSSTFGGESEAEWIKRMSQKGSLAPAKNLAGVKVALGGKKTNFLGTLFDGLKMPDIKTPDFKAPDITWLKELFKKNNLADRIADKKRSLNNE